MILMLCLPLINDENECNSDAFVGIVIRQNYVRFQLELLN